MLKRLWGIIIRKWDGYKPGDIVWAHTEDRTKIKRTLIISRRVTLDQPIYRAIFMDRISEEPSHSDVFPPSIVSPVEFFEQSRIVSNLPFILPERACKEQLLTSPIQEVRRLGLRMKDEP